MLGSCGKVIEFSNAIRHYFQCRIETSLTYPSTRRRTHFFYGPISFDEQNSPLSLKSTTEKVLSRIPGFLHLIYEGPLVKRGPTVVRGPPVDWGPTVLLTGRPSWRPNLTMITSRVYYFENFIHTIIDKYYTTKIKIKLSRRQN